MEKRTMIDEKELYRHYKGGFYVVLCEANHSETLETLVIYRDENGVVWARPKTFFYGLVEVDGRLVKRFAKCV